MKKILAFVLVLAMSLCAAGCAESAENTAPVIRGVRDQTAVSGSVFNALSGVSATDAEDGDLTGKIEISATPSLTFRDGKATLDGSGNYDLVYTVTDKNGATEEVPATLTVTKRIGAPVLERQFDFSTLTATDNHGWELRVGGGAQATGSLREGSYVVDVTNPGGGDVDVQLVRPGFAVENAEYRVNIWAKSSAPTYAHLIARDENAAGWETFGGAYNVRLDEHVTPVEMFFTAKSTGSAELMLNLGKITPNPGNPSDTTPKEFTVTIDKIELYQITGVESENPAYTADFSSGKGLSMETGDGAAAETRFENGAAIADIRVYPQNGGVWSIRADLGLGDVKIQEGTNYYYHLTLNAENGLEGECLVESKSQYHEARTNFNSIAAAAGEDVVISGYFGGSCSISDPVVRLQIGNAPAGKSQNTITFKSLEFGTLDGDKEVVKTIETFAPIGKGTAYEDSEQCPWETFNGTDDDNKNGVGTIWTEDGSLFYRIDDGGSVDWHNKLICPFTLPADSACTIVLSAKASKPVSCDCYLNPVGGWDPRIAQRITFTTEEQPYSFTATTPFDADTDVELLFQFGSSETAELGEVTVEITDVRIYRMPVQ
ncbi:MAG: hypothetical protein IKN81_00865 [Oscillospiraceae bacterium]|nr:hypothetical protein [Oscillospiraceae bacterium]